jgi:ATP diphosphatase
MRDRRNQELSVTPSRNIADLIEIMARLRTPGSGCPWDLAQNFLSIAPYTIEEAYEVADAIERSDLDDLKDELGDLLLQVVFHSRMAEEIGRFEFADVVEAITAKMIRRHPHIFADGQATDAAQVKLRWNDIKAEEKAERTRSRGASESSDDAGLLSDVPITLPALSRAVKLQNRAGEVGFDWNDPRAVMAKIREEIDELEAELAGPVPAADRVEDELGDLLFAIANLARHLAVDAEAALRRTNAKFVRRFRYIETRLTAAGQDIGKTSLDAMEALWTEAKRLESPGR